MLTLYDYLPSQNCWKIRVLLGHLWLGEVPTLLGVTGGILALGGMAVVNLHRAGLAGR